MTLEDCREARNWRTFPAGTRVEGANDDQEGVLIGMTSDRGIVRRDDGKIITIHRIELDLVGTMIDPEEDDDDDRCVERLADLIAGFERVEGMDGLYAESERAVHEDAQRRIAEICEQLWPIWDRELATA
jgi:hypothetical protein